MSEVKRISVFMHGPNKKVDMVEAAHLDRVTAERDAALSDAELWRGRCGAKCYEAEQLQQRLTAADERADRLESGLKWESERNALLLASLTEAEDMLSVTSLEAGQRMELLEELLRDALNQRELSITISRRIEAALKPAERAKCERCGCSTVETCDDLGCGYLGAGNGAPE
jgi:hypothetical protein